MIENKVNLIVERLCELTKTNSIIWERNDVTQTSSKFSCVTEDGTQFSMEVKFVLSNGKWTLEQSPSLWIRNESLPNGSFYVYGGSYKNINNSLKEIRDKLISEDDVPTTDDLENSLSSIAIGMSKEVHRDSLLNKILSKIKK